MASNTPTIPTEWTTRQIVLATLFVLMVLSAFWLIYRFHQVILLFFLAIMLGTAVKPAVDWLAHRGLKRVYAEVLIYIIIIVLVVGFLLLAVPMILEQSTALLSLLGQYYRQLRSFLVQSPSSILQRLGFTLPFQFEVQSLVETPQDPAVPVDQAALAAEAAAQLFQYLALLGSGIFSIVAVFLMAFYWTLEGDRAIRSLLLFVPSDRRENVREVIEAIQTKVGDFLLGQAILCLIIGVLQLIAYLLIGLPNAFVLALLAGVMEAVPVVGPFLGVLPALLLAATTSPDKIIWVVASGTLIQFLENNLLVPKVMDQSVGVNPMLTILAFAALSSLFGLTGAVIAIPLAAVLQLLINRTVFERSESGEIQPKGRDYNSYLRYQVQELVQDVRKQVRFKEERALDKRSDQIEDAVEAVANELDRVLAQSSQEEGNLA